MKKDKDIIPVVVFVYNRPDLLTKLLTSLKYEEIPLLYIFSDGAKNENDNMKVREVRDIVKNIDWCEKIIHEHSINIGLGKSIKFGVREVFTDYNELIVFEDDLICTKGTYKYLTAALKYYRNDEKVMSVTGWTHPNITPKNVREKPYFDGKAECWSWGTWARAWNGMEKSALEIYNDCVMKGIDIEKYGSDLPKMALEADEKNLWAIGWWYLHILNEGLCLRPPYSLIETTGWDGRGTTITPEMIEWANPPLKNCPPIIGSFPKVIENEECPLLWKKAIDKNGFSMTKSNWFEKVDMNKVDSNIWLINNLLTETECRYLILKTREKGFKSALNGEKHGRFNEETFINNSNILKLIRLRLLNVFNNHSEATFSIQNTTEVLEFYRYKKGDFVSPHSDTPIQVSESNKSNYTLVIYLNEGFEGGETFFRLNDLKIKTNQGSAVLFDQNLIHGGSKIIEGEKYILRLCILVDNLS
jgi:hypothetical protein